MDVLFSSDEIQVRIRKCPDMSRIVVVFDAYSHSSDLNRKAWGEAYFTKHNITAVYVLGRANDWYQFETTAAALDAIRSATRDAARVMTYGTSMGGYAAVRFASHVGAHIALAISPQYSINPIRAPFDSRWDHDAQRIQFRDELDGLILGNTPTIVVYDPYSTDRLHARRISEDISISHVRIPRVGHSVPLALMESNLLQTLVQKTLDGTLNEREFERKFRVVRKKLSSYHSELATHQPPWRRNTAIRLAQRAVSLNPKHNVPMHALAQILAASEDHQGAVYWYEKILNAGYEYLELLMMMSQSLWEIGDRDQSILYAKRLSVQYPSYEAGLYWYGTLLIRVGQLDCAIQNLQQAVSLNPSFSNCAALLGTARNMHSKAGEISVYNLSLRRARKQIRKIKTARDSAVSLVKALLS